MPGYEAQFTLSRNGDFVGKVRQCLIDIAVERIAAGDIPNIPIANSIIRDPDQWADRFTPVLLVDDVIDGGSTDAQLKTRALQLLPHYAPIVSGI